MRYNNIYNAYLGTGICDYKGIVNTALNALQFNDTYTVCHQLQNLSRRFGQFISATGLHVSIKSLRPMHEKIDSYVKTLSRTPMLTINTKRVIEEFLYKLLSSFRCIHDFCSYMHNEGF